MYRILQKHSKSLKFAHFCSGNPFTPKHHSMLSFQLQSLLLLLFLFLLIFLLFPSARTSRAFSLRCHLLGKHLRATLMADSLFLYELKHEGALSCLLHSPSPLVYYVSLFLPFDFILPPKVESRRQKGYFQF